MEGYCTFPHLQYIDRTEYIEVVKPEKEIINVGSK